MYIVYLSGECMGRKKEENTNKWVHVYVYCLTFLREKDRDWEERKKKILINGYMYMYIV